MIFWNKNRFFIFNFMTSLFKMKSRTLNPGQVSKKLFTDFKTKLDESTHLFAGEVQHDCADSLTYLLKNCFLEILIIYSSATGSGAARAGAPAVRGLCAGGGRPGLRKGN